MKRTKAILISYFLIGLLSCTVASDFRRIDLADAKSSVDGDVSVSGCLIYIKDAGVTFLISRDCESWESDREGNEIIDVANDSQASKEFIERKNFPICVTIFGRLERYRYSQEDFLIPSGYLRSSIGIIHPKKISVDNCQ